VFCESLFVSYERLQEDYSKFWGIHQWHFVCAQIHFHGAMTQHL
jgi:hypothetical protein